MTDGALADHWFNAPFKHKLCRQFNNMDVKLPNAHFGSNCTTFISESFLKGLALTHNDGSFFDFSSAVEISLHLAMHTSAGGNLAWLSTSVNDPVFHPHHGHIDNLFSSWQDMNPKNKRAFHGPKKQQKDGAHPPWNAKRTDMINFAPLADSVAVEICSTIRAVSGAEECATGTTDPSTWDRARKSLQVTPVRLGTSKISRLQPHSIPLHASASPRGPCGSPTSNLLPPPFLTALSFVFIASFYQFCSFLLHQKLSLPSSDVVRCATAQARLLSMFERMAQVDKPQ